MDELQADALPETDVATNFGAIDIGRGGDDFLALLWVIMLGLVTSVSDAESLLLLLLLSSELDSGSVAAMIASPSKPTAPLNQSPPEPFCLDMATGRKMFCDKEKTNYSESE